MAPSLLIFDCDGVLVDSERLSHEVLRQMLAEHGVALSLQEALDRFMGTSTERCLELLSQLMGSAAPADFMHRFRDRTFAAFETSLQPVAGVPELLRSLPHRYCVASNGPREKMRLTLRLTGLIGFLEGRMFSAQDVARPKPAPDLFLRAAAALGARPDECLVIEDSPTGVAAARAAGMPVFGYAWMGQGERLCAAGAAWVFDSMAELPRLLGTMGSISEDTRS